MTSIDNVTDIEPFVQYVAAASQTVFDYPYPIFQDADLVVLVDGVEQALTTDYTVTGEGEDTGGTVTLVTALAGGEIVTIYRDIAIERDTDIAQNGPWSSVAYNDEQDKTYLLLQQLKRDTRRALRIPLSAEVDSTDIELDPTNYANKYLTFDSDGKPTPAALSSTTMTQSTIGALLYPRTDAERDRGVTPTDTTKPTLPTKSVQRYASSFTSSSTSTQNAAGITTGVSVESDTVKLPPGTFASNAFTLPPYTKIQGGANRGTILTYSGSATLATLGGTAGSLYWSMGMEEMQITLSHVDGKAVQIQGGANTVLRNMYIEGAINATRTSIGVKIDGSNASAFANHLENVYCNHLHVSFKLSHSGSVVATQTMFSNCYGYGDKATDATSIGLLVSAGDGNGAIFLGGNLEQCNQAVSIIGGAGSITMFGTRFESNTTDIIFGTTPNPSSFFGLINLDNVTDNSGTGYERHTFVGCVKSDGSNYPNSFPGVSTFRSVKIGDTPLIAQAYAGQTAPVFKAVNSAGTTLASVNADGTFTQARRSGTASPSGVLTPLFIGELYVDTSTPKAYMAYGVGNTQWMALN